VTQRAADLATTGKVKSAFALSKRLSAYAIEVDTSQGTVRLTGQVPSEIEKELATSVAKDTTGVAQVDNQLRVEPGVQPSEASRRESARVMDLEIRADLRERLAASPELKDKNLQIGVQDRVVTLTGQVEMPQQKAGAEQLARAIPNVAGVVNNLAVGDAAAAQTEVPGVTESAAKDRELEKQVLFAFFGERDNFANAGAIRAEARDTLTGPVASRAERALAERITREVSGVRRVNNQLTLVPTTKP
jgi:osmotically-inducible protein OsmY